MINISVKNKSHFFIKFPLNDTPRNGALSNGADLSLIFNLNFQMSSDVIYEERSIYTFWDLLGDVGGLLGELGLADGRKRRSEDLLQSGHRGHRVRWRRPVA